MLAVGFLTSRAAAVAVGGARPVGGDGPPTGGGAHGNGAVR
jgi:hypothetical protein